MSQKEDQNDNKQSRPKGTDSGRSSSTNLQLHSSYSLNDRVDREYRRERGRRSRSRSGSLTSRSQRPITSGFLTSNKDIDNEEESIKKKLEKKLREKEESYQKVSLAFN